MKSGIYSRVVVVAALLFACLAHAEPFSAPGDMLLRHDLQRLNDSGAIDIPLTTWPVSWHEVDRALADAESRELPPAVLDAFLRVKEQLHRDGGEGVRYRVAASAAEDPRVVRTFEETPREDGELSAGFSWAGPRFFLKLNASAVADPFDDEEIRPDGSYVGMELGNWLLSAGWQDRWWGPGRDGSLVLSSNARPTPGVAVQRNSNAPFQSKWLRWIGPWSATAFMNQLDDERAIDDALLFGLRVTFKPIDSLEIGLSRTAQWCGDGRHCDLDAFVDLLIGNDNKGVNVDPVDEPGNQLAGIDIRWRLPAQIPVAAYMQWIGEDTRRGGPEIGSWLRQVGVEHWGTSFGLDHRTHVEVADTMCREGGFGFADAKPDCAYEHGIYQTGYRYRGRVLGHAVDGDGRSYSLGSTLVQSSGHSWNLILRYMELNRAGTLGSRHTLAAFPRDVADIQLTHTRMTAIGRFGFGLGANRVEDDASGGSTTDAFGFITWTMQ